MKNRFFIFQAIKIVYVIALLFCTAQVTPLYSAPKKKATKKTTKKTTKKPLKKTTSQSSSKATLKTQDVPVVEVKKEVPLTPREISKNCENTLQECIEDKKKDYFCEYKRLIRAKDKIITTQDVSKKWYYAQQGKNYAEVFKECAQECVDQQNETMDECKSWLDKESDSIIHQYDFKALIAAQKGAAKDLALKELDKFEQKEIADAANLAKDAKKELERLKNQKAEKPVVVADEEAKIAAVIKKCQEKYEQCGKDILRKPECKYEYITTRIQQMQDLRNKRLEEKKRDITGKDKKSLDHRKEYSKQIVQYGKDIYQALPELKKCSDNCFSSAGSVSKECKQWVQDTQVAVQCTQDFAGCMHEQDTHDDTGKLVVNRCNFKELKTETDVKKLKGYAQVASGCAMTCLGKQIAAAKNCSVWAEVYKKKLESMSPTEITDELSAGMGKAQDILDSIQARAYQETSGQDGLEDSMDGIGPQDKGIIKLLKKYLATGTNELLEIITEAEVIQEIKKDAIAEAQRRWAQVNLQEGTTLTSVAQDFTGYSVHPSMQEILDRFTLGVIKEDPSLVIPGIQDQVHTGELFFESGKRDEKTRKIIDPQKIKMLVTYKKVNKLPKIDEDGVESLLDESLAKEGHSITIYGPATMKPSQVHESLKFLDNLFMYKGFEITFSSYNWQDKKRNLIMREGLNLVLDAQLNTFKADFLSADSNAFLNEAVGSFSLHGLLTYPFEDSAFMGVTQPDQNKFFTVAGLIGQGAEQSTPVLREPLKQLKITGPIVNFEISNVYQSISFLSHTKFLGLPVDVTALFENVLCDICPSGMEQEITKLRELCPICPAHSSDIEAADIGCDKSFDRKLCPLSQEDQRKLRCISDKKCQFIRLRKNVDRVTRERLLFAQNLSAAQLQLYKDRLRESDESGFFRLAKNLNSVNDLPDFEQMAEQNVVATFADITEARKVIGNKEIDEKINTARQTKNELKAKAATRKLEINAKEKERKESIVAAAQQRRTKIRQAAQEQQDALEKKLKEQGKDLQQSNPDLIKIQKDAQDQLDGVSQETDKQLADLKKAHEAELKKMQKDLKDQVSGIDKDVEDTIKKELEKDPEKKAEYERAQQYKKETQEIVERRSGNLSGKFIEQATKVQSGQQIDTGTFKKEVENEVEASKKELQEHQKKIEKDYDDRIAAAQASGDTEEEKRLKQEKDRTLGDIITIGTAYIGGGYKRLIIGLPENFTLSQWMEKFKAVDGVVFERSNLIIADRNYIDVEFGPISGTGTTFWGLIAINDLPMPAPENVRKLLTSAFERIAVKGLLTLDYDKIKLQGFSVTPEKLFTLTQLMTPDKVTLLKPLLDSIALGSPRLYFDGSGWYYRLIQLIARTQIGNADLESRVMIERVMDPSTIVSYNALAATTAKSYALSTAQTAGYQSTEELKRNDPVLANNLKVAGQLPEGTLDEKDTTNNSTTGGTGTSTSDNKTDLDKTREAENKFKASIAQTGSIEHVSFRYGTKNIYRYVLALPPKMPMTDLLPFLSKVPSIASLAVPAFALLKAVTLTNGSLMIAHNTFIDSRYGEIRDGLSINGKIDFKDIIFPGVPQGLMNLLGETFSDVMFKGTFASLTGAPYFNATSFPATSDTKSSNTKAGDTKAGDTKASQVTKKSFTLTQLLGQEAMPEPVKKLLDTIEVQAPHVSLQWRGELPPGAPVPEDASLYGFPPRVTEYKRDKSGKVTGVTMRRKTMSEFPGMKFLKAGMLKKRLEVAGKAMIMGLEVWPSVVSEEYEDRGVITRVVVALPPGFKPATLFPDLATLGDVQVNKAAFVYSSQSYLDEIYGPIEAGYNIIADLPISTVGGMDKAFGSQLSGLRLLATFPVKDAKIGIAAPAVFSLGLEMAGQRDCLSFATIGQLFKDSNNPVGISLPASFKSNLETLCLYNPRVDIVAGQGFKLGGYVRLTPQDQTADTQVKLAITKAGTSLIIKLPHDKSVESLVPEIDDSLPVSLSGAAFIVSNYDYFDNDVGMKVTKGLSFSAGVMPKSGNESISDMMKKLAGDTKTLRIQGVIPAQLLGTMFAIVIPGEKELFSGWTMRDISLLLEINRPPSFGLGGLITIPMSATEKFDFNTRASFTATGGLNLMGQLTCKEEEKKEGSIIGVKTCWWENPLGIKGLKLADLAVEVESSAGMVSGIGFRGRAEFLDRYLKIAAKSSIGANPVFMMLGDFRMAQAPDKDIESAIDRPTTICGGSQEPDGPMVLTLKDIITMWSLGLADKVDIEAITKIFGNIGFYEAQFYFVPLDGMQLAGKIYPRGTRFYAKGSILGKKIEATFKQETFRLTGKAIIEPINIMNMLSLTGIECTQAELRARLDALENKKSTEGMCEINASKCPTVSINVEPDLSKVGANLRGNMKLNVAGVVVEGQANIAATATGLNAQLGTNFMGIAADVQLNTQLGDPLKMSLEDFKQSQLKISLTTEGLKDFGKMFDKGREKPGAKSRGITDGKKEIAQKDKLIESINSSIDNVAQKINDSLQKASDWLKGASQKLLDDAKKDFDNARQAMENAGKAWNKVVEKANSCARGNVVACLETIGYAIVAAAESVYYSAQAAYYAIKGSFELLAAGVTSLMAKIAEFSISVVNFTAEVAKKVVDHVVDLGVAVGKMAQGDFAGAVNGIGESFNKEIKMITGLGESFTALVVEGDIEKAAKIAKEQVVDGLVDYVGELGLTDIMTSAFSQFADTVITIKSLVFEMSMKDSLAFKLPEVRLDAEILGKSISVTLEFDVKKPLESARKLLEALLSSASQIFK